MKSHLKSFSIFRKETVFLPYPSQNDRKVTLDTYLAQEQGEINALNTKKVIAVASLLLCANLTLLGLSPAIAAPASGSQEVIASAGIDYKNLKSYLEKDFQYFFTQVVSQDETGLWVINNPDDPALNELSKNEIQTLLKTLNSTQDIMPVSSLYELTQQGVSPSAIIKDWNKYALCVIEGAAGFKVPPSLAVNTVSLIKENRWGEAAETVLRGLAEAHLLGCSIWQRR